jgi:hypothetical protein
MQPYPQPNGPLDNDRNARGPLSRTWPQLFKKRRRYSPVRESAQQQQQQQAQQIQQVQQTQQIHIQAQPPPQQIQQQPVQLPIHPIRPLKSPTIQTHSITSPSISSIRSPSITADTASTISSISHASSAPPNKIAIARRSSSIIPADSNGMPSFSYLYLHRRGPVTRNPHLTWHFKRIVTNTPQEPVA